MTSEAEVSEAVIFSLAEEVEVISSRDTSDPTLLVDDTEELSVEDGVEVISRSVAEVAKTSDRATDSDDVVSEVNGQYVV